MTITDEAVQAARKIAGKLEERTKLKYISPSGDECQIVPLSLLFEAAEGFRALTAALPFLQGVKVEPCAEFGSGKLCVDTGHFHGRPAVFIRPVKKGGKVGEKASPEDQGPLNELVPGEWFMTFPTDEQAQAVADALVNQIPAPSTRAQALEEAHSDLLNRLNDDIAQLERMAEQAKFAGSETGVRVKSPSVLLADLRDAAAAIRALSSQPVADGWLPIETAPKDGTYILIWSDFFKGGKAVIVKWDEDKYANRPVPRWTSNDRVYGARAFVDCPPTHWRPLPASPGASE